MENRRVLRHLLFHQEEIVFLLSNLRIRAENQTEGRMYAKFIQLFHETADAINQVSARRRHEDLSEDQDMGVPGDGNGEVAQQIFGRGPDFGAFATPQAPLFQQIPAQEVYPARLLQPPPGEYFERPRPAPAPPGRQRDPIIGPYSTSVVIDPPHWGQPAPQPEAADEVLIDFSQDQEVAFGMSQAEGYSPAALDLMESPLTSAATSAPSEASSSESGDVLVTRIRRVQRRGYEIDDDEHWEDVQHVGRNEGGSANMAGDTVNTANDVDTSSTSGGEEEIDWNRRRAYTSPSRRLY